MRSVGVAVLCSFASVGLAAQCTTSSSTPWPFSSSGGETIAPAPGSPSSSGTTSSTDACAQFKNDLAAYKVCAEIAQQGECAAVGCPGSTSSSSSSTGDLISNPGDDLISSGSSGSGDSGLIKRLGKRAILTCTGLESCFQYTDKSLLCFNPSTGEYPPFKIGS